MVHIKKKKKKSKKKGRWVLRRYISHGRPGPRRGSQYFCSCSADENMTLPNSKYDHKSVLVGSHVPKGKRHFSEQLAASPTHIQTSFNSVNMPMYNI